MATTEGPSNDEIPLEIAKALVEPEAHGDEFRIHEIFSWLRANNPLGKAVIPGYDPFWVVAKHADILEVSRQNALFRNSDRPHMIMSQGEEAFTREQTGGSPQLVRSIVTMDAPEHPKFRAMTQSWFLPASVQRREARIRGMAQKSVQRMLESDGRCDFVSDVALHYPLHVIMDILGVPEEDEPTMLRLTQELFGSDDPDLGRDDHREQSTAERWRETLEEFDRYFGEVITQRRMNPTDDVATVIAQSRIDGELVSEADIVAYYVTIASAGHDTTSASTAGGVMALAQNPEIFRRVKADHSLIPGLVDEAIRWTSPVRHFTRTAATDYTLRGRRIQKGDWMMLLYPSGNRDEEVFVDPFTFDIDRKPNKHLAFGYGGHICLGQHLAKLEMRILFEELLPRLRSLELAGEPRRAQAPFIGGLKSLPIRFTT